MLFRKALKMLGNNIRNNMFKEFLSALVYEMLKFSAKHPKAKQSDMSELRIPAVFKEYLGEASEAVLAKDVKLIIMFLNDAKNVKVNNSKFFKAFIKFLTEKLASSLDKLPATFYKAEHAEQIKIVEKLIASDSVVAKALKNLIITNSYQELASEINELCKNIAEAPYVLVQSPREIDSELKSEIRENLNKDFESSFPVFQINKNLIGGLRVFVDGTSHDYSWFSRISSISNL
mgnify:FL=1